MKPLLDISAARVFFDGIFSDPRVAHPEGVAVHVDGSIWCGNEVGELLRIDAEGTRVERMGSSDGFLLGIAFDSAGNCFACDLRHAAIFRYDAATGAFEKFAASGIKVPNYPVVDEARGCLYVSDSSGDPGVGIYRYDLATGEGGIWCEGPTRFANGMAMAPDGSGLYVVESFAPAVSLVPIESDGSAGALRRVVSDVRNVPDGLAFGPDGTLYISCYEPSRIYRWRDGGPLELLIEDPHATTIAHPTNVALKGAKMYTANLGRWHITEIDLSSL
ncbi:MAG: SMP-30/gluconolactonase/LRE family protein [Bauldia litoralis]